VAVLVEVTGIAGVEPPVAVDRLGRRRLVAVVAEEDRLGAQQDLAVVGDGMSVPGHGLPTVANLMSSSVCMTAIPQISVWP